MGHWKPKNILFSIILAICLYIRNVSGCNIVYDPEVPPGPILHSWIYDTFRGNFWQNQTSGIAGIQTSATSAGGYFNIGIVDSLYVLSTTKNFDLYEETETADTTLVTSTFRCTDGSTSRPFPVWINIRDTNNNPPIFQTPPGGFVFTVTAPLAPGVEITGCLNNIVVRDIDLTTDKIIFELEENPYFEIEKEIFKSQATPKEFRAILRTKTFIRSIPEPITLTVSATDHDQTGDPPRTTTTTITIIGNPEFELPEEPVFSQTFYLADYTSDNRVVLTEPITLKNGYDELVKFDIKGDFSANFELESIPGHANQKSIRVVNQLPSDVLRQTNIYLIVTAERELTSGASATIVLRLPEDLTDRAVLRFTQNTYIGTIKSTGLIVDSISLSSGYDEDIQFLLSGDFVDYFSISAYKNVLTLWLDNPLPVAATEKGFIVLEIEARRERAISGWTSVVIEVIRQEIAAPVFTQAYYRGAYNAESGLHFNQNISLSHGYDETVTFFLDGEFGSLFNLIELDPNSLRITNSAPISNELIHINRQFLFTIVATKAGALSARSAVSIDVIKGRPNVKPNCRCRPRSATRASQSQPSLATAITAEDQCE
ncbi:hypothetical protein PYW07_015357 [Mythimna separata]|uniref:Cadherin domain-containing protein n=1 Tax=Mythimna separata TaxID=271217 RepID=A0AAD7YYL9_MYTSE|nr:hypothetical protein PYW07_015357 [Mythimna separata]